MKNRCVVPNCKSMIIGTGIVCEKCLARTRAQLAELPKLHAESANFLEPGRSGSGSGSSEQSIGVSVPPLDFSRASDLLFKLWGWAQVVMEETLGLERKDEPLRIYGSIDSQVTGVCRFLLKHMPWIERQTWIDVFVSDVAEFHGRGLAVTGQLDGSGARLHCPTILFPAMIVDDSGELETDPVIELCHAWVNFPSGTDLLHTVFCRRCQTDWTKARLIAVALDTDGAEIPLDAEAIAAYLRTTAKYVRTYAKRHHIEPDHGLYDLKRFIAEREQTEQRKGA